jgi:hypothetical protein
MDHAENDNRPPCQDASPITGRKCHNKASVTVGQEFHVCGECALRRYLHGSEHHQTRATRERLPI